MFPPGRYGRRRDPARQRRRRWLTYLAAGLVIAAGVAIAVKLYRQYAHAPYQVTVVDVRDISDHGVTVIFDVTTPAGQGALCTVRGHTRDGRTGRGGSGRRTRRAERIRPRSGSHIRLVTTKRPVDRRGARLRTAAIDQLATVTPATGTLEDLARYAPAL